MSEIQNFGRYFDDKIAISCCNNDEKHWYFEVDPTTKCECGRYFTYNSCWNKYIFCSISHKLFCRPDSDLFISTHMGCPKNNLIKRCNRVINEEIYCLYDKLRIIMNFMSKDCIRHTVLLIQKLNAKPKHIL